MRKIPFCFELLKKKWSALAPRALIGPAKIPSSVAPASLFARLEIIIYYIRRWEWVYLTAQECGEKKWRRPSAFLRGRARVASHTRMLRTSGGEWAAMTSAARVATRRTANERRCSSADGRKWLATEVRPATRNLPPPPPEEWWPSPLHHFPSLCLRISPAARRPRLAGALCASRTRWSHPPHPLT